MSYDVMKFLGSMKNKDSHEILKMLGSFSKDELKVLENLFTGITVLNNDKEEVKGAMSLLLDGNGHLKVYPHSFYKNIDQSILLEVCTKSGTYNIYTSEQISFLMELINCNNDEWLEIGSGNGILASHLGIKATDSYMQEIPEIAEVYKRNGQAPVKYGSNVEKISALDAVKKYKPKNVLGCWVTHIFKQEDAWREGNQYGVDEMELLSLVDRYVFIGHEGTHKDKRILDLPHKTIHQDWLLSRSVREGNPVIWIWDKEEYGEYLK